MYQFKSGRRQLPNFLCYKELIAEPLLPGHSVCNEKSPGTKMYSKTFLCRVVWSMHYGRFFFYCYLHICTKLVFINEPGSRIFEEECGNCILAYGGIRMNAYPFTVFKRSNRPYYFVSYKDSNGKFLSPISTKQKDRKRGDANCLCVVT